MAGFNFVNAYAVRTSTTPAGKEANKHDINLSAPLGTASIDDSTGSYNFSGNDVSAIGISIGGQLYYGWISRPIKVNGVVKGFYFWTDPQFVNLATAQADGNTDGDGNAADNIGFILVVDQSYFAGLGSSGYVEIGSSSDRVDAQLNSLLPPANSAPVANADAATAIEGIDGAAGTNPTGNVLTGVGTGSVADTDANVTDVLAVTGVSNAAGGVTIASGNTGTITTAYGTLTLSSAGTYTYTVNNSATAVNALLGGSLVDTFNYTVSDGNGHSATTTLTVTIQGRNDSPTANNDFNVAKEKTTSPVYAGINAVGNVLTNDTDPDSGDVLTISGASVSTTASVATNTLVFTTDPDGGAGDTLTLGAYLFVGTNKLFDNSGGTATANQISLLSQSGNTITLSATPSAASLAFLDGTSTIFLYQNAGGSALKNTITADYAFGSSSTITVASVAGINVGDAVTGPGLSGVTVTAVNGATSSVTLSSTVSFASGTSLTFGKNITSGGSATFAGNHGTLVLNSNGSYTYTPFTDDPTITAGTSADDVFTYSMHDAANSVTKTATLTITVYGSPSAALTQPTAVNDTNSVTETAGGSDAVTAGTPNVLTNDTGTGTKTVLNVSSSVASGAAGSAVSGLYGSVNIASTGGYTYTATNSLINALTSGQSVTDTFTYAMKDNNGVAFATLTVTINGTDDASVGTADTGTAVEAGGLKNATAGSASTGNVLANDTDPDDAAGALRVVAAGAGASGGTLANVGSVITGTYGTLTLTSTGTWTYSVTENNATVNNLAPGGTLTETFNYKVAGLTGAGAASADTLLTITIQGAQDTLAINDVFVNEDSPYAMFAVSGAQGIAVTLALGNTTGLAANDGKVTIGADAASGDIRSSFEWYNGSAWVPYAGSATIPTGGTLYVRVTVFDDSTYEGNESFTLTAATTSADSYTVTGFGTVGDEGAGDTFTGSPTTVSAGAGTDDDRPTLSFDSPSVTEGGDIVFTLSLSQASTQAIHFTPVLASGTAVIGTDTAAATSLQYKIGSGAYAAMPGNGIIIIPAGQTQVFFKLATSPDTIYENSETFTLGTGYVQDAVANQDGVTGTATINEDTDPPPVFSVGNATVTEGNAGTTTLTFTVTKTGSTEVASSVHYSLADGTATAGSDYAAGSGTLNFLAGDLSKTITVTINGDTIYEADETLGVTLDTPVNATIGTGTATGTITNDDAPPVFSIANVSAAEGNSGTTTFTFTVTKTGGTALASSVNYATADGSATVAGGDYSAASGTLNFAAGDLTKTFTVTVNGDTTYENNELFSVALSTASGATISGTNGSATGTITNDDSVPVFSIASQSVSEGDSGTKTITFTVTKTGGTAFATSVDYATSDGTATTANSDYAAASGTLNFAAGDLTKTFTVTVNGDTTYENDETFGVALSSASGATISGTNGSATGTITNDDTAPVFSITSQSVTEGDTGTKTITFTVAKTGNTAVASSVNYSTSDGTATLADGDYAAASGTLNFAAGDTTKTFTVTVNGDTTEEADETFNVSLGTPSNATVSGTNGSATGTILNDDSAAVFSIGDVSITEGDAGTKTLTFTVTKAGGATPASVHYSTSNGTATAGSDYVADSGTLNFAAADTTKTVSITINGDTTYENNETFTVALDTAIGGAISGTNGSATGTITNDDSPPVFSIANVSAAEGDSGTTTFTFTVTKTGGTAFTTSVNYATSDGTATLADGDYAASSGTLTFLAGDTTKTFTVTVNGDTTYENSELFNVALSAASGATISGTNGSATGTIANDDSLPVFSIASQSVSEGDSGTKIITFTVTKTGGTAFATSVDYATSDGTATTADGDYAAASGTLNFAAGDLTKTFTVTVNGDTTYESNEAFGVALSSASGATISGSNGSATGTITNDDSVPVFSIASQSVSEGDSGTKVITFTVTKTGGTAFATSVDYATSDGTATVANSDYAAASGTLNFAAGDLTKTFTVTVNGDTTSEGDETFGVALSSASGATISGSNGSATGTILNDDSGPVFSIADVSVAEGDSGTTTFTFTVTKTGGTAFTTSVNYATSDGTATLADSDYLSSSGTLTFLAGESTKTFTVTVNGDTTYENNELFNVALSSPSGATISGTNGSATGTITNDDSLPVFSIASQSVTEGDSGTKTVTFTVTKTGGTALGSSVGYSTVDGTATVADGDYAATSGTLNFAAGDTTKTFTVTVNGDATYENNEAFGVALGSASGATISGSNGSATGNITNDDSLPVFSIANVSVAEGDSGTTTFTFTVTRTGGTAFTTSVNYATSDGTATLADGDYTASSGTLTFLPGDTTGTFTVTVNGDTKYEGNELFNVALSSPTGATISGTNGSATGTITNDDSVPVFSIASQSVTEGDSGTKTITFTVTKTGGTAFATSVDYATSDGTATVANSDYAAASGTLNFAAGDTIKTFTVTVNGDTTSESNETFGVALSAASGATVSGTNGAATGTITNDDSGPVFSIADVSVSEGDSGTTTFTFTVTKTGGTAFTTSVNYGTSDGSATVADGDYTASSGTLTFLAGDTTKTFTVTVNGDTKYEGNELFNVALSAASGGTVSGSNGTATGTITNDDSVPVFSIASQSVSEGDSGTKTVTFTVTKTGATAFATSVDYATNDSTATTADGDYAATSGTLNFAAGDTTKTFTVTLNGDSKYEGDETFGVALSSASGATISGANGSATGTITNDDTPPVFSVSGASVTEGNAGTSTLTFTVTRTGATALPSSVHFSTLDGTATADSDYAAAAGTLNFLAGETTRTISVTINGDTTFEDDESFFVVLDTPTGATIGAGAGTATATLVNDDAAPVFSVSNVNTAEGNAGTTAITFTVTKTGATALPSTVHYATSDGTATAGSDYTAASGTLTFLAGETSKTVTINVGGDTLYENNETFQFALDTATNATISGLAGSATATLVNDDAAPVFSVASVSTTEGDAGTQVLTFTVTRTGGTELASSVHYATSDGTAVAGVDYVAASGTLNFASGEASKTISVTVNGDTLYENDEAFSLTLDTPVGATIGAGAGSASGTLVNDDAAPVFSITGSSAAEGNAGTTTMTFTVTRTGGTELASTVHYATGGGTATAGVDYTAASGTLTFAAGETSQTFTVDVNGDTTYENDETFTVALDTATGATISAGAGSTTVTIQNDDAVPVFSVAAVTTTEGDAGTKTLTFTVTRTGGTAFATSVHYATVDGTALAGSDYTAASGTLNFAADETTKTISVTVNGDTTYENDETFSLALDTPVGATLAAGGASATATLANDDALPVFSIANVNTSEGDDGIKTMTFTVTKMGGTAFASTVHYGTADGTATAGVDYSSASGTLSFDAGETTKTFTVDIHGDVTEESDETFTVVLDTPTLGTIGAGAGAATGTITNDDSGPVFSISDVSTSEGNSGTKTLTFTVTKAGATVFGSSVHFSTVDGTALSGSDYAAASGTLSFLAGETSKTITVTVNGDTTYEANETFGLLLESAVGATISAGAGSAVATLVNDDAVPAFSVTASGAEEGDAGTKLMWFTVTKTGGTAFESSVQFATQDGTAVAGSDYEATAGTLIFAAGETSKTIAVTVNGDTTYENDETFTLTLASASGATIDGAAASAVGTLLNDDALPVFTVADVATLEGDAGAKVLTFTVTRTGGSAFASSVSYATGNGTAVAGTDYAAASGTLNFAAGETSKSVSVTVFGDTTYEPTESFTFMLGAPTGATLGAASSATGTIVNDDSIDRLVTIDVRGISPVSEGSGAVFEVVLSSSFEAARMIQLQLADGTASGALGDYGSMTAYYVDESGQHALAVVGGATTLPAGVGRFYVSVVTGADTVYEVTEDFSLAATIALSGNSDSASVVIADDGTGIVYGPTGVPTGGAPDNDAPRLTVSGMGDVSEGSNAVFTVSLSNAVAFATTVSLQINDVTTQTGDYKLPPAVYYFDGTGKHFLALSGGSFTLPANVKTVYVSVPTINDDVFEGSEAFTLRATLDTGTTTSTGSATSSIVDDGTGKVHDDQGIPTNAPGDDDRGGLTVVGTADTSEGQNAIFTVTLSHASASATSVALTLLDTTTQPGDYSGAFSAYYFDSANQQQILPVSAGAVMLPVGVTTFYVSVATTADSVYEGAEAFRLQATAGTSTAQGSAGIVDDGTGVTYGPRGTPVPGTSDDDRPTIAVAGKPDVSEGSTAVFTVSLSNASAAPVAISLATAAGTAGPSDYGSALAAYYFDAGNVKQTLAIVSGIVSLPAGVTSFYVGVPTTQDGIFEGAESFSLNAAIVGGNAATGTAGILDDGTGKAYDDKGIVTGGTPDNDSPTLTVVGTPDVSEGSTAVFTVTLSNAAEIELRVNLALGKAGDSATSADYASNYAAYYFDGAGTLHALAVAGGQVTLPAGVGRFYVSTQTTDDAVLEGVESLTLSASVQGGPVAQGAAGIADDGSGKFYDNQGTIVAGGTPNDDRAAITVTGLGDVSEGSNAVFTVTLSNASVSATDVALTLGNAQDTAAASDYSPALQAYYFDGAGTLQALAVTAGKVSLPAGVVKFYVSVATTADSVYEGSEAFTLGAATTQASSSGTSSILDNGVGKAHDAHGLPIAGSPDDDRPTLAVNAPQDVSEGSNAVFAVTLSRASQNATQVTATLGAVGDTASSTDYSSTMSAYYFASGVKQPLAIVDGKVQLPPGVTAFFVSVATVNDTALEGKELVSLTVSIPSGSGATGVAGIVDTGSGRIYDDHGQPTSATGDDDRTFNADLDPGSDNGASHTDHVTSIITPEFVINAGMILQAGQTVQLLTPDGRVAGTANVSQADATAGMVKVATWQLDDGAYDFTARILDGAGGVVAQGPVHVTVVTDLDGVMPSVELAAHGGDFNQDGVQDWTQNNVAQLPLTNLADYLAGKAAPQASFGAILAGDVHAGNPGAPVILSDTAQLLDISVSAPPAPLPENFEQASALFNFSVTAQAGMTLVDMDPGRAGLQTRVVIDLPSGVAAQSFVKWNAATGAWFEYLDDGNLATYDDGATLLDLNGDSKIDRVVITLTDGGAGDADGIVNGIMRDPGMLVLKVQPAIIPQPPAATPVYSVLLTNGDRFYTVSTWEAQNASKGVGAVFEGARFDSLTAAQGGRQLLANYNPLTTDWYWAANGDAMPYECYESHLAAGFQAAAGGQGPGVDYHLYMNSLGITQMVTSQEAASLGLAGQGYADRGVIFNTTSTAAFTFDAEAYLVANKDDAGVRALVQSLAGTYTRTSDAGFIEAVEQHYLVTIQTVGVSHGGSASAADLNAAFGTSFGA